MEPGSLLLGLSHKPSPSLSSDVGSMGSRGETGLLSGHRGSSACVRLPQRTDGAGRPSIRGHQFYPILRVVWNHQNHLRKEAKAREVTSHGHNSQVWEGG